jgi:hypothetical protein
MDGKRRLPLLPSEPKDGDEPARPAWQWVVFGAVAVLTAWLPLSGAAVALASRLAAAADRDGHAGAFGVAIFGVYAGAIALGSFGGGYVVGRWGGLGVGVRESTLAGLAAALAAVGATWVSSGVSLATLTIVAIACPSAAAGGWRGTRVRARTS